MKNGDHSELKEIIFDNEKLFIPFSTSHIDRKQVPCYITATNEKTAEVMTEDGYLKTGDKGSIDSEGYITITGRLKEIFKTSKGKVISGTSK